VPNITQITPPRVALIDERTGAVTREWYRYFYNLYYATGGENGGAIPTDRGGTGTTQIPTNGQILVGNGSTNSYNATDLGVGAGIAATVGAGSLSIENTGVLSIIAGTGIEIDQSTGDVTISATGAADQESQVATSGQTVFTLTTMTYVPGSNSLSVFIDGVNQQLGVAFTETNSTTVTFSSGLHVGAKVRFATA
jgi:hypothetical protein